MSRDGALGLLLLAAAVAYWLAADAIPPSTLADAVGPGGIPKVYAVVLGALALILVGRGWRGARISADSLRPVLRVSGLLAMGVAYLLVLPWVGYPVSLAGLIIGTAYYQGGRLDRRVVGVGVAGAAALWLLFVLLLGIQHPAGAWVEWLRGAP